MVTGYSFLAFNLLCAPCFAAIGAIRREMNNVKWTWFAIGYQTVFAYAVALLITQLGTNPVAVLLALIIGGIIVKLVMDRKKGRSCCGDCAECNCCKGK